MTIFNRGTRRMRVPLAALVVLIGTATGAAQHQHHDGAQPRPTPPSATTQAPSPTPDPAAKPLADRAADAVSLPSATREGKAEGHTGHSSDIGKTQGEGVSPHDGHLTGGIRMTSREGSGTSWQPASTPAYMLHKRAGGWAVMLHGEAKVGVNAQGGPRGVTKFESQNWIMPMATRRIGRGTLELRGMFSLEPLTYSGAGSPQLFQSGEVYQGRPIVDAQHPHDLLMELSAGYTLPVGERGSWFAYVGYPGEPALGPVAFMHRASASENPSAPLAHHLQDSTHVSFGVFTSGFTYRWLKVEGSVFNGREPDEDRYGFEAGPWDSRSVRVSVAPNANWVFQYSYGLLKSPELLHEGDTRRQTASVQYNRPLKRGNWATSLIWGRNREGHDAHTFRLNSYLLESTLNFKDRNYLYGRAELVDKKDILRPEDLRKLGFGEHAHPQFRVGAYTVGYVRDVYAGDNYSLGLGADATLYSKPEILDAIYGKSPVSYKAFLRIRLGGNSSNGVM